MEGALDSFDLFEFGSFENTDNWSADKDDSSDGVIEEDPLRDNEDGDATLDAEEDPDLGYLEEDEGEKDGW